MSFSTGMRLCCCTILLLTASAVPAQTHSGWEKVDQCDGSREPPAIMYVRFFSDSSGVIAGEAGFIRYTRNGGVTWRQPQLPRTQGAPSGRFSDDIQAGSRRGHTLYLVALHRLIRSTDEGESWQAMKQPLLPGQLVGAYGAGLSVEFYDVSFVSEKEGWVLCGVLKKGALVQSYVLHTRDAGERWDAYKLPTLRSMVRMHFAGNDGWIVGEEGTILHSSDAGVHWEQQTYPTSAQTVSASPRPKLLDIEFWRDRKYGIIVGKGGTILKTEDGGRRWFLVSPVGPSDRPDRRDFVRVQIVDEERSWVVGDAGCIFYSDDGGTSWKQQVNPVADDLYAVFMLDNKRGWAAGDRRALLRYDAEYQAPVNRSRHEDGTSGLSAPVTRVLDRNNHE